MFGLRGGTDDKSVSNRSAGSPGWGARKPDVFHSISVCMGANQMAANQGVNEL